MRGITPGLRARVRQLAAGWLDDAQCVVQDLLARRSVACLEIEILERQMPLQRPTNEIFKEHVTAPSLVTGTTHGLDCGVARG